MSAQIPESYKLLVVKDNLQLIHLREGGIDVRYFQNLQEHTNLPKAELAQFIGVDPNTAENYQKQNRKFTGDAAEKLLLLHRLFALGDELFGSTKGFTDWLHVPSPGLEGKKPVEILHSVTGIKEIEKQLSRIIHGYAA